MADDKTWVDIFKCDMREPYMGNTFPVYVEIRRMKGRIVRVVTFTEEGIRTDARSLSVLEVSQLFKD